MLIKFVGDQEGDVYSKLIRLELCSKEAVSKT